VSAPPGAIRVQTELFTPEAAAAAPTAAKSIPAEDAMVLGFEGTDRLVRA